MLRHTHRVASATSTLSSYATYLRQCLRQLNTPAPAVQDEPKPETVRQRRYPAPDYSPYIDPSSLKQSLEYIREVNRAGLIRRVHKHGYMRTIELPEPPLPTPIPQDAGYAPVKEAFKASKSVIRHLDLNEYAGSAQPPRPEWKVNDSVPLRLVQPWLNLNPSQPKPSTATESLSSEIEAFGTYMTPTKKEQAAADRAVGDIQNTIGAIDSATRLELVGSRASGLAMPLSDLDFNVVTPEGRLDDILDRDRAMLGLRKLKLRLKRNKKLRHLIFVTRAKIPIIRGIHDPTGLEFQIQHTTNAYNSTQYVQAFLQEYPTLRSLFTVLRQLLTMRGLSDGSKQGLSSYPLINMILASIKFDAQTSRAADAGSQLLSFLKLYSNIDFDAVGLTVTPPKLLPKVRPGKLTNDPGWAPRNPGFAYSMYLMDPADPSNDLGRNCGLIRHVQATFLAAKAVLDSELSQWQPGENKLKRQLLLRFLVGDYTTFEVERASLRSYLSKAFWSVNGTSSDENDPTVENHGHSTGAQK